MVTITDDGIVGVPMSWEDYLDLPDDTRAEYADGFVYVSPSPTYGHQWICRQLSEVLRVAFPSADVIIAAGWTSTAARRWLRVPDVSVLRAAPHGDHITDPPVIAVEVMSSNRSDDRVRKYAEYFEAGAEQYWIVDPRDRAIDVFGRGPGGWDSLARLTDAVPDAVVTTSLGDVVLSLATVLDR